MKLGLADVAFCNTALLACGLDVNDQANVSGSVDVVLEALPSKVTVSPTRTPTMYPESACTDTLAAVAPLGDTLPPAVSPPPHPAANKTHTNINTPISDWLHP